VCVSRRRRFLELFDTDHKNVMFLVRASPSSPLYTLLLENVNT
jgi:hypothetical protein